MMEEEKFRRNGKKKYETITDKMLTLYARLNALVQQAQQQTSSTGGASSSGSGCIEIKLDLSQLSASGQSLLKDRRLKERIELMHLNISAN